MNAPTTLSDPHLVEAICDQARDAAGMGGHAKLTWDLETLPADPERFAKRIAEAEGEKARAKVVKEWQKTSLIPSKGQRILCAGVQIADNAPMCIWEMTPAGTVEKFAELVFALKDIRIMSIGHNTYGFDLPAMKLAAIRQRRKHLAAWSYRAKKWGGGHMTNVVHIDTYAVYGGDEWRPNGSVDDLLRELCDDHRPADPIGGADVAECFRNGRLDLIRAHVLDDCRAEKVLFEVLDEVGLVDIWMDQNNVRWR